jgi:hypothetical protein
LVAFRRAVIAFRHAEVKERAILRPGEEAGQMLRDPELDGLVVDHAFLHERAEQNFATGVVFAFAGVGLGFERCEARLFGANLVFGGFDALFERELFLLDGLQSSVSSWRDFAAPRARGTIGAIPPQSSERGCEPPKGGFAFSGLRILALAGFGDDVRAKVVVRPLAVDHALL